MPKMKYERQKKVFSLEYLHVSEDFHCI